ncbi:MAG: hypothetical protein AAFV36_00640 [Myxococcota bacterium]
MICPDGRFSTNELIRLQETEPFASDAPSLPALEKLSVMKSLSSLPKLTEVKLYESKVPKE